MQPAARLISTGFSNILGMGKKKTANLQTVEMFLHILILISRHIRLYSIAVQFIITLPLCSQDFVLF